MGGFVGRGPGTARRGSPRAMTPSAPSARRSCSSSFLRWPVWGGRPSSSISAAAPAFRPASGRSMPTLVVGVEPNPEMRRLAASVTRETNVSYREASAYSTGLPDAAPPTSSRARSRCSGWIPSSSSPRSARILRPDGVFAAYQYASLVTGSWEADAAWAELRRLVRRRRTELGLDADSRRWPVSRELLEESGVFRFTMGTTLHNVETGTADRLIGFALSEGSLSTLPSSTSPRRSWGSTACARSPGGRSAPRRPAGTSAIRSGSASGDRCDIEPDDAMTTSIADPRSSSREGGGSMLAPMPIEPPPSGFAFPSPATADQHGRVVVGGDLEPGTLLAAYRAGLFPMRLSSGDLAWWSPDPRGVLPADLRVCKSLLRTSRRFEIRVDTAFDAVVAACAERAEEYHWITDEIQPRSASFTARLGAQRRGVVAWPAGRSRRGPLRRRDRRLVLRRVDVPPRPRCLEGGPGRARGAAAGHPRRRSSIASGSPRTWPRSAPSRSRAPSTSSGSSAPSS